MGTAEPRRAPGQRRQGAGIALASGKASFAGVGWGEERRHRLRRRPAPGRAPEGGSLLTPRPQSPDVLPQGALGGSLGHHQAAEVAEGRDSFWTSRQLATSPPTFHASSLEARTGAGLGSQRKVRPAPPPPRLSPCRSPSTQ